jgi:uncharacterized protein with von Willebrand factor type A (vWA) domain
VIEMEMTMNGQGDNVVILKREELIQLLVDSYLSGIDTVKQVLSTVNPSREELINQFEKSFDTKEKAKREG